MSDENAEKSEGTHVALLDAKGLEDVGGLADLLEELLVGDLEVLSRLVGLPNDGGLKVVASSIKIIGASERARERGERLTFLGCLYAHRSTQL